MKKILTFILIFTTVIIYAQDLQDLVYTQRTDEYAKEMCRLDVYNINKSPELKPIFVWFHGGGITTGDKKSMPPDITNKKRGYVLVSVNYRLSPKIKAWEAIDDCAQALVWVFQNAKKLGGDKNAIFIGGHSAGGYLSGMLTFAPKYLKKYGINNTDLAGAILLSAQVTKHFQVRKDSGDDTNKFVPVIDEFAILGNVQNKIPPLCIIVGDRHLEWKCRVEENFLLEATVRCLKTAPYSELFELQGTNHGTVADALASIATRFIKNEMKKRKTANK